MTADLDRGCFKSAARSHCKQQSTQQASPQVNFFIFTGLLESFAVHSLLEAEHVESKGNESPSLAFAFKGPRVAFTAHAHLVWTEGVSGHVFGFQHLFEKQRAQRASMIIFQVSAYLYRRKPVTRQGLHIPGMISGNFQGVLRL